MKKTNKLLLSSLVLTFSMLTCKSIAAAAAIENDVEMRAALAESALSGIQEEKERLEQELKNQKTILALAENQEDIDMVKAIIENLETIIATLNAQLYSFKAKQSVFDAKPVKLNLAEYEKLLAQYRALQGEIASTTHTHETDRKIIALVTQKEKINTQLKEILQATSESPYYYSGKVLGDLYSQLEDRPYIKHTQYGDTFTAPESVSEKLIHIVGTKQNESICGFLTFAHALAIDTIIKEKLQVTSDTIQEISQHIFDVMIVDSECFKKYKTDDGHKIKYLECDDAEAMISEHFDSLGEASLAPGFHIAPGFYKLSVATMDLKGLFASTPELKSLVGKDIKTRTATHFMISSGRHWSLVSIIKNPVTGDLNVVHVNSSNNPLAENSPEMPAIREIVNLV